MGSGARRLLHPPEPKRHASVGALPVRLTPEDRPAAAPLSVTRQRPPSGPFAEGAEVPEGTENVGTSVPTAERVETARRLSGLRQHERVSGDDPHCWWCDYPWPCPTIRWITRVLQRASDARGRS